MARASSVEFTGKTRDQAAARANGHCESCGVAFSGQRPEYDHILPAALGGKPDLANCRVLCRPCHVAKTADDVRGIRKSDRQRKAANGAKPPTKAPIASRGFEKHEKVRAIEQRPLVEIGATNLARRFVG